jgi:hypothetical protein
MVEVNGLNRVRKNWKKVVAIIERKKTTKKKFFRVLQ